MMAWILASLLAGFAAEAGATLSPETNVGVELDAHGPDFPPPKP
jgi:hypothetical protein